MRGLSCIIKEKRKGSNKVYAYESTSYWIPGRGPRTKRRYLGTVDPITGEIIPSKKQSATQLEPIQDSTDITTSTIGVAANNALNTPRPNSSAGGTVTEISQDLTGDLSNEIKALRSDVQKLQTQMGDFNSSLDKTREEILSKLNVCINLYQENQG